MMGKDSLSLDNGPVRKIPCIATIEYGTKLELLADVWGLQDPGLSAEILGGVMTCWEKRRQLQCNHYNDVNYGQSSRRLKGTGSDLTTFEQGSRKGSLF